MLAMPFIEIAGFVIIGSKIGVFATLGLVILSAMLGFFLLRVQGIGLLQRIRTETAAGRVPDREVVHGAMLVLAAILLGREAITLRPVVPGEPEEYVRGFACAKGVKAFKGFQLKVNDATYIQITNPEQVAAQLLPPD